MPKTFQVHVSNGKSYKIEAQGFADAAAGLLCDPTRYPLPAECVVGIEGPAGTARFYKRRADTKRNLFPISASAAAVESHMMERE